MANLRNRAVELLKQFFRNDTELERRALFHQVFAGLNPNPCDRIIFDSVATSDFAAHAVDQLLTCGCATRGRHYISLLIEAMTADMGRQLNPDFYDLPRALDELCCLPTRAEEQHYLARLIREAEAKARLYSPLQAIAQTRPPDDPAVALFAWADDPHLVHLRHDSHRRLAQPETRDYPDILAAFDKVRQAALLGPPGAGKSTTLRRLAVDLARRAQQDPAAPLPLFVEMGKWTGAESLLAYLAAAAPEIGWAAEKLSMEGRLILLLDGINEVPTATRAEKAADMRTVQAAPGRLFVSCRKEDYTGDLDLGLDTLTLEPLTPRRIRDAVHQWVTNANQPAGLAEQFFWQLAGDRRLSEVLDKWLAVGGDESTFWSHPGPDFDKTGYVGYTVWHEHIPNPRNLVRLAANPFMLTMLFHVWWDKKELPRNRGGLFRQFIKVLLSREHLTDPDAARLLTGLAGLAWRMQREQTEPGVLTVAPRSAALAEFGGDEQLLKKALDATILEGTEEFRFRHQLLQEYFTGQALQGRLDQTGAAELWPPDRWWERTGWEEAAVLLAGLYSDDCTRVIRWLAEAQPEVAAQCILDSGAGLANRESLLRDLQSAWLPRLTDPAREPQPEGRAAVGRALGRLNLDTRGGVGVVDGVPDIDWVEIPAGKTSRFYLARYPVTNAQFQAFLDATDGYRDDRWWQGLTEPEREPATPHWSEPNHPRETVSWYEAMAFCGWLSHRTGLEITLPTEEQWERAARGPDGREYPWGNEYVDGYANTWGDAHKLGRTSAVGIYPEGASQDGVLDLSGNVWEWCLNEYEKPTRVQRSGTGPRVLRGGSWDGNRGYARAAFRSHFHPGYRDLNFGLRVVRRPHR